jgi:hypothetical protein
VSLVVQLVLGPTRRPIRKFGRGAYVAQLPITDGMELVEPSTSLGAAVPTSKPRLVTHLGHDLSLPFENIICGLITPISYIKVDLRRIKDPECHGIEFSNHCIGIESSIIVKTVHAP